MYTSRPYTRYSFAFGNSGGSPSVYSSGGRSGWRQGSRFTSGGSSLYSNGYDYPDGGRVSSWSRPSSNSGGWTSSSVGRYHFNGPRTTSSSGGTGSYSKPLGGSGFNWWGTSTNSGRRPQRPSISFEPKPVSGTKAFKERRSRMDDLRQLCGLGPAVEVVGGGGFSTVTGGRFPGETPVLVPDSDDSKAGTWS
ncbi:Hypp4185 [Branchiostoma lanceolatum]|uniref:Hypp4185 protein n=1 Tax=Branchiostoma lanceolatum TaxID=7740 RepID=A0A8K0A549_BRALA|nr:Hypp4185 [Branchiostoma lanceolatum]